MWLRCSPMLALMAGFLTCDPPDDLKKLQGEWEIALLETNGLSAPGSPRTRIIFEGDRRRTVVDGMVIAEFVVKLDPAKDPKWIDLKVEKSEFPALVGETCLGIYRIDGDTLEVCDALPGGERPSELRSKIKKHTYAKYKRVGAKAHE